MGSADPISLTDPSASFPANLAGAPVSITDGLGRLQQSIIAANTATQLTIVTPWSIVPDTSSSYQIGGVHWSWRSGWFRMLQADEDTNPRDFALTYQPTPSPATADVQLFFDHADAPSSWGYATSQDGVTILPGDPNLTISLQARPYRSGWSLQRFSGHSDPYGYGDQYVSIAMAGVQGPDSVRIFQVDLGGAQSSEDV